MEMNIHIPGSELFVYVAQNAPWVLWLAGFLFVILMVGVYFYLLGKDEKNNK